MRKESNDVLNSRMTCICKYFLILFIVLYIIFVYSYTSTKDVPFDKAEKALKNSINDENMLDVSSRGLKRYYGFNTAEYEGVMMYISNNGMSAEEILLIKVNDDTQINELEEAIRQRIKNRINDFKNYAPDQAELLKNAEIIIKGKYIFVAVSKNAGTYKKIFLQSL